MSKDHKAKDKHSKVIVYGAPWCGFCHTAMHYFDQKGVKYKYVDVDKDPKGGLEALNKSGQRGIPVIDMAGDIVVGFDRPKIDIAIKEHSLA